MKQANAYLDSLSTEQVNADSLHLDRMSGLDIARLMNQADQEVHLAVQKALPQIGEAIEGIAKRLQAGGRLLYIGAGTSGRLGVLDASECPPTFGVDPGLVQGIIAGGDTALRKAIEGAEDSAQLGRQDLLDAGIDQMDAVVAISASGFAPYCAAALDCAREAGALAIALSCNQNSRLSAHADIAIEAPTGAEVLMGSTRLKAGSATKMMLNMLSTGAMVRTGRVYQNLMVDLNATNQKLNRRARRIVALATGLDEQKAGELLTQAEGHAKTAVVMGLTEVSAQEAREALRQQRGWVAAAVERLRGKAP